MSIVIDDETLQTLQMSESEMLAEIAILMFQQERFTLGQAAISTPTCQSSNLPSL
jgi:predicted HTH domain antitoxin